MAKKFYEELGLKFWSLRKENGLSRQTVADHFGVSRQTVFLWEKGEREVNADIMFQLFNYYNADADKELADIKKYA